MKPLILTFSNQELEVNNQFDNEGYLEISIDGTYIFLKPDQVNELITRLAACLKQINKPVDILASFKVPEGQIIIPRGPNQLPPGYTNDRITPPVCLKQPEEFKFHPELLTKYHYIAWIRRDDGEATFGKYLPEDAEYYKTVKVLYASTNWDEVVAVARTYNYPKPGGVYQDT